MSLKTLWINVISLFIPIILLVGCGSLEKKYVLHSPYQAEHSYRYKVNLHAHSKERDKNYAYSPLELFRKAREFGFDAFAITDLPHAGGIVDDPGVDGILHIPGIEYGGQPHLIGIGIDSLTLSTDKQVQIDHIKTQGGLAYLPHPYWGGYDENMLDTLYGFDGVAVFNSLTFGVAVYNQKESEVISYNEKLIDHQLTKGNSISIMAEEDTKYEGNHQYGHQLNTSWLKIWGEIPPEELEVKDILDAIASKQFTSHARHLREHPDPPEFEEITVKGLNIFVKLNKACDISFIGAGGVVKREVKQRLTGTYKVSPEDVYIRIKAICEESNPSWAWTNPIYIRDLEINAQQHH